MTTVSLNNGHSRQILCADAKNDKIISGGEENELVLWDKCNVCCRTKVKDESSDDVTSVVFSRRSDANFYLSCGDSLLMMDVRNLDQYIWRESFETDEINQICLDSDERHVAVANDSSFVFVMDLETRQITRKLRGHTNVCYTAQFRPNTQSLELVTGGYDCQLIDWNCEKNKPFAKFDIQQLSADGPTFINPPYVLSVMFSVDGTRLACGVGDATVKIFDGSKKSLTYVRSLDSGAHTNGVTQVRFSEFDKDRLFTGGNDGKLNMWDLSNIYSEMQPTWTKIQREKINWISLAEICGNRYVVVCDTSSVLTLNPYPE